MILVESVCEESREKQNARIYESAVQFNAFGVDDLWKAISSAAEDNWGRAKRLWKMALANFIETVEDLYVRSQMWRHTGKQEKILLNRLKYQ